LLFFAELFYTVSSAQPVNSNTYEYSTFFGSAAVLQVYEEVDHRRRSSVNFEGARHFCPKTYAWKIDKMPEFYMIFARKNNKIPEFYMIYARKINKMPEFYTIFCPKK